MLQAIANLLVGLAGSTCEICRIGGEEFALVAPGVASPAVASLADQLRRALASTEIALPSGRAVRLTVSLGVATLSGEDDAETLTRRANAALYEANRAGRDRVRLGEVTASIRPRSLGLSIASGDVNRAVGLHGSIDGALGDVVDPSALIKTAAPSQSHPKP